VALGDLDSRTWERTLEGNPLVIVPVGALEAHGPHLPLAADVLQAVATARGLAERVPAVVAPPIEYGSCTGVRRFPGTVSLALGPLAAYVGGVLAEFGRMGARRILVLSGHAERGHMAALREAADHAMAAHPATAIVVLSDYDFVYELRGREAPATDGHGGLLETSRLLHLAADRVGSARPVVADRGSPFRPRPSTDDEWPESVLGDTREASAALGARIQAHVLDRLEATVRDLLPA